MTGKRKRMAWSVSAFLVITVTAAAAYRAVMPSPAAIAERISGLELPWDIALIHHEGAWQGFGGDGYSLWIFRTPANLVGGAAQDCQSWGYEIGTLSTSRAILYKIDGYIDLDSDSCFLLRQGEGSTELSVVSDEYVIVYVFQL